MGLCLCFVFGKLCLGIGKVWSGYWKVWENLPKNFFEGVGKAQRTPNNCSSKICCRRPSDCRRCPDRLPCRWQLAPSVSWLSDCPCSGPDCQLLAGLPACSGSLTVWPCWFCSLTVWLLTGFHLSVLAPGLPACSGSGLG